MEIDMARGNIKDMRSGEHRLFYKNKPIHEGSRDECYRVMRSRLAEAGLSGATKEVSQYLVRSPEEKADTTLK